ncbi:hypothetical protein ACFL5K_06105 [Gemmatimonadota bacterium]
MANPKASDFWEAIYIGFFRIPFFEIAYALIIAILIWRLPAILKSVSDLIRDDQTFYLGVGVCLGLFVILILCFLGLVSRTRFYRELFAIEERETKIRGENTDKEARDKNKRILK